MEVQCIEYLSIRHIFHSLRIFHIIEHIFSIMGIYVQKPVYVLCIKSSKMPLGGFHSIKQKQSNKANIALYGLNFIIIHIRIHSLTDVQRNMFWKQIIGIPTRTICWPHCAQKSVFIMPIYTKSIRTYIRLLYIKLKHLNRNIH